MTDVQRLRCLATTVDGMPPQVEIERIAAIPGVLQVQWWSARVVPQPEDVKNSLNAYTGVLDVFTDSPDVIAESVLPVLEGELGGVFSFLRGIVSDAEPEFDLLRETPPQHISYQHLPIAWKHGHGPVRREPTGNDLFRYTYFFAYRQDVSWEDGEDWYLGHHTREGKQLSNLVHYVTWHRRPTVAPESSVLGLVRVTELCFERFEDFYESCYTLKPSWNMGEKHTEVVWVDYFALFLGPEPDLVVEGAS